MIAYPHNLTTSQQRFRVAMDGNRKAALFAESAVTREAAPCGGK